MGTEVKIQGERRSSERAEGMAGGLNLCVYVCRVGKWYRSWGLGSQLALAVSEIKENNINPCS